MKWTEGKKRDFPKITKQNMEMDWKEKKASQRKKIIHGMDREREKARERSKEKGCWNWGRTITLRTPSQFPVWAGEAWRDGQHSWKKNELCNARIIADWALGNTSTDHLGIKFLFKVSCIFKVFKVWQNRFLAFILSDKIWHSFVYLSMFNCRSNPRIVISSVRIFYCVHFVLFCIIPPSSSQQGHLAST